MSEKSRIEIIAPKSVFVLSSGPVNLGIFTNLLAAYNRLRKSVPPSKNDGIPSYSTVYRRMLEGEKIIYLHTALGSYSISKMRLYKKAY